MIMLHNNQLQNQCFRPSLHHRSNSNTPNHPIPNNITLLTRSKLRRSQSNDSNTNLKVSSPQEKGGNQSGHWLSNHFLDIKDKFKEIFRHKNSEIKRSESTARKNSVHSRIKQRNLSVICPLGLNIDRKRKLIQNLSFRPFQNKKLVDLKKGKLFRGIRRNNCNDNLAKRVECEGQFQQLVQQQPMEMDASEDEMGESYLKSQYAALQMMRQQQQTIRTQKMTIQSSKFNKHRSQIKTSNIPICLELDSQIRSRSKIDPIKVLEEATGKRIQNNLRLGVNRSSLSRRIQNKRQILDEVRSKGSSGVIIQI